MALQLTINCPIHNISIMQEPISYMNLWVCPECGKCYTDMNVDMLKNMGYFKGKPLVALPESERRKIQKQVEEYKEKYVLPSFLVPHNQPKKKKILDPRDKKKTASITKSKSCPQIESTAVHLLELPAEIKIVPQSAILKVILKKDDKMIGNCLIVSDCKEQDTQNGLFWSERTLAKTIIAAVLHTEHWISYKGIRYTIEVQEYKLFSQYKKTATHFFSKTKPQLVYVFKQKNIAHYNTEAYETVTAFVHCAKTDQMVPMSIIYDRKSNIYLINLESYQIYSERYGLPYIRLKSIEFGSSSLNYELSDQSELALYGYSVGKKEGLSDYERQALLSRIISNGFMKKHEIINHIEWLIHTREGKANMEDSCSAWKSDLAFILRYEINTQHSIFVKGFQERPR